MFEIDDKSGFLNDASVLLTLYELIEKQFDKYAINSYMWWFMVCSFCRFRDCNHLIVLEDNIYCCTLLIMNQDFFLNF